MEDGGEALRVVGESAGREEGARAGGVVEGGEAVEGVGGVAERVGWWWWRFCCGVGGGGWGF